MQTDATLESILLKAGAKLENKAIKQFNTHDPAQQAQLALNSDVISPITPYGRDGLIEIKGDDKITFCQGQFSNDIAQVSPQQSQFSAFCSPKGRILACLRLFAWQGSLFAALNNDTLAPTLKRLQMFVMRAKVTLAQNNTLCGIGLSGPNADTLLSDYLGQSAPSAIDSVVSNEELCAIRYAGPHPRFALYGNEIAIASCWQTLQNNAQAVAIDAWNLLDIHAGIPTVYNITSDAFVPQMANLDLLNGINFKKGCYVGQEIVARTHYLGRLKRRMFRLSISTSDQTNLAPDVLKPGLSILAPAARKEQSVGQLVMVAPSPSGNYDALAVLILDCIDEQLIVADHPQLTIKTYKLPYLE